MPETTPVLDFSQNFTLPFIIFVVDQIARSSNYCRIAPNPSLVNLILLFLPDCKELALRFIQNKTRISHFSEKVHT